MKATVVGLVTPHLLRVVDWHVRDAVARTIDELGHLYNAQDLRAAYIQGLETAAREAGPARVAYARVLQAALAAARKG